MASAYKKIPNTLLALGNIDISGNEISTTDTNGDIELVPNGTGSVIVGSSATSSSVALHVQKTDATTGLKLVRVSTDSGGPSFRVGKARAAGYPTTNDVLGDFFSVSQTGANGASTELLFMRIFAAEAHSAEAAGNTVRFYTVTNGTVTASSRIEIANTGYVSIGGSNAPTKLEVDENETITTSPSDEYSAAITLDPAYTAASAQTVTRHNYMDVQNVDGGANVTVTDACVMRFNAAAGTHKAVDSGSSKTSPGTVSAWVKVNINGTVHYMPCYTSKTS